MCEIPGSKLTVGRCVFVTKAISMHTRRAVPSLTRYRQVKRVPAFWPNTVVMINDYDGCGRQQCLCRDDSNKYYYCYYCYMCYYYENTATTERRRIKAQIMNDNNLNRCRWWESLPMKRYHMLQNCQEVKQAYKPRWVRENATDGRR